MQRLHRIFNTLLIPLVDQGVLILAFLFFYWLAFISGITPEKEFVPLSAFLIPLVLVNLFWLLLFGLSGLYGKWKHGSRFDEIIAVYKTMTVGAVFFLVLAFSVSPEISSRKLPVLGYWAALVVLVGMGRVAVRTGQRWLLFKGIGRRSALVVGSKQLVREMIHNLERAPALGYDVKGVILTDGSNKDRKVEEIPVRGTVADLHRIIGKYAITDILIALELKEEEEIFRLVSAADSFDVDFLILPGPADVLARRMMYNHLYGFPMIRIFAEPMPPWEKNVKKLIDIVVSLGLLILCFPLLIIIAVAIKFDSPGPIFYGQQRVGYRGRLFKVYKFRSMIRDAEKHCGPVWAGKDDPRITRTGRIIRKFRFDELPQFYNILLGDMSLVGPRPERPFFVEQLKKKIPYYQLRLKVRPGLTGWAQVKHTYDSSLDSVREKLKFDLYYIENMSLNMDFKILIATIFVVLGRKGAH